MPIEVTTTLGGRKEPFEPLHPGRVSIYVCGPTVYDVPHIGHARMAVVFDVLRRHFRWRGFEVLYVQNITDVDDKIIRAANEQQLDSAVVAERYTRTYEDAMRTLGVLPPDIVPRASGHVPEMVEMIEALIARGFAYPADGSVYFAVEKYPGYGKLSGRSLDDLRAGERVEPAPGKHHPLDFALWKAAKPGEPSWPSPWGRGRPGWHIECSAMSVRYLGCPFDIHGGGADLVFPHHENEIAQAEAALGCEPFARYWVHNGHVQVSGEKMSKSLKNYVLVENALEDYPPQVLRLFILSAHYRSPVSFGPESLAEAEAVWDRVLAFLRVSPTGEPPDAQTLESFGTAMDDDLNTPRALAVLHDAITDGHRAIERGEVEAAGRARSAVLEALAVLGCQPDVETAGKERLEPLVALLLELRERARGDRDFARADEIRSRLAEAGVRIEDSPAGARWFLA